MRLLLTRRWLGMLALAAVFAGTCVFLGRWQWGRYVEADARATAVAANYHSTPRSLDAVLSDNAAGLADPAVWSRVVADGHYDPDSQLLVRNRPQNVVFGYEVLVPLVLPDGTALLVDRGWVPNAERADVLPEVPPAPAGPVQVVGWLRQGEPDLERNLPPGQLASIDLTEAARRTGYRLRAAYLVLESETTGPGQPAPARPQPLLPPETGTGPHFAYALQWWTAAPVGFVLIFVFLRREYREGAAPRPTGGETGRSAAPVPVKRRWIWDDEDE